MSVLSVGASHPTAPRATHEFRLQEAVRGEGNAFVRYRDGETFHAVSLVPSSLIIYVGRNCGCEVRIQNDGRVSRRHARLIFGAGQWSIEDGPSRNGTFLGNKRTVGEQILADGALITVGRTLLSLHAPGATVVMTVAEEPSAQLLRPTSTQRKVLAELVRPFLECSGEISVAPTNAAIAAKLGYQVATIRDAVSDLYRQAGLARGASNQRVELVRLAIRERAVILDDIVSQRY